MTLPQIIAIDGPAASGKSTLGKNLAETLGYLYFDTGVMYRALTWLALHDSIHVADEGAITRLAETTAIDVRPPSKADGRAYDVCIGEWDITWEIRSVTVDENVSVVAAYAGVRKAMTLQQRRIGLKGRVVMVGRDIGTVVLPEADLKIYLEATLQERARRRYQELSARGEKPNFEAILKAMSERDRIDSTRKVAPLRPAADAVIVNTDGLDPHQVLTQAMALVEQCTL